MSAADAFAALPEAKRPPHPLDAAGTRLWVDVMSALDLDPAERVLLLESCRSADLLDVLDALVREEGPLVQTRAGTRPHPAAVEARQQRQTLARLLTSLRLPDGLADGAPPQGVTPIQRPQRRGTARGFGTGLAG